MFAYKIYSIEPTSSIYRFNSEYIINIQTCTHIRICIITYNIFMKRNLFYTNKYLLNY